MPARTEFPPVRACLFDMDGLLLDTEDIYTICINEILAKYGKPNMPWSLKAKLQGRPGPTANALFREWAQLPIDQEQYNKEYYGLQAKYFPNTKPLAGVEKLLSDLNGTKEPNKIHIALATSAHKANFDIKTEHLQEMFSIFLPHCRVLGDDPRIPTGKGKPFPEIYLLALETINQSLPAGEKPITPEECLVFEDSVPGVEAGRRAGMRVVWVPHPMLKKEYAGREAEVMAGRTLEAGEVDLHQVGELDDGWADYLPSLVGFPYEKYGIKI